MKIYSKTLKAKDNENKINSIKISLILIEFF